MLTLDADRWAVLLFGHSYTSSSMYEQVIRLGTAASSTASSEAYLRNLVGESTRYERKTNVSLPRAYVHHSPRPHQRPQGHDRAHEASDRTAPGASSGSADASTAQEILPVA